MKYPKAIRILDRPEMEEEQPPIELHEKDDVEVPAARLKQPIVERRITGNLAGISFFLGPTFDWLLAKDDEGFVCLVPRKKQYDDPDDDLDEGC